MQNWDEVKTAFYVAKTGTASGAAGALGVHHATVIRHVDALEARLGIKLFQRHGRGFAPTEAAMDLLESVTDVDRQLAQLETRLKNRADAVEGELVVTSLPILSPFLMRHLGRFQNDHPKVWVSLRSETRVFQIERGEAHVALRAGAKPDTDDYVVQWVGPLRFAPYVKGPHDFKTLDQATAQLGMIGFHPGTSGPNRRWIEKNVPAERVRFQVQNEADLLLAAQAGLGVTLLPVCVAQTVPDLHRVGPILPDWSSDLWMVTHVDLHRTAKIQAITKHLKMILT